MVDYSKWRDIEISDDEDETHPNIDTPSLFRWRHQARIERMAEIQNAKDELKLRKQSNQARLIDVQERIKNKSGDEILLQKELNEIQNESKQIDMDENSLLKKERKAPWNVDTISKPGFEKTVLNPIKAEAPKPEMSETEQQALLTKFIQANEAVCKEFGVIRKYEDSKRFLQKHPELVCDETANYLVLWCINLAMDGKHELAAHVTHQCVCMQYIMELSKQLSVDPRSCVSSFFSKIQDCGPEYRAHFESEIDALKQRVKTRAHEKLQEIEEEERKARLGPGGLDPEEVFEELPDELKKCFEERDVDLLRKTIAEMPLDVAKYHMKRCVDSGLWVSNETDNEKLETELESTSAEANDNENDKTEPIAKSNGVEESSKNNDKPEVTSVEEVD